MEIPSDQPVLEKSSKKVSVSRLVVGGLGMVGLVAVGFVVGRVSTTSCSKSVLGASTQEPMISRLAMLFNLNTERPSQQTNIIQLAPSATPTNPEPTEIPTPEPEDDEPDMIWSGINRNPKPTSTPTPNNVIITPDLTPTPNNVITTPDQEDSSVPSPTPKYKLGGGRNSITPTPTPNKMNTDKASIVPLEIQQLIDDSGLLIDRLQVVRSEGEKDIRVSGEVREKLFGFLTVGYPISFKVDQDMGTIESASVPWWRTLWRNPFGGNISQVRCGDGICNMKEDYSSCPADCTPVCGNGTCEYGEGSDTCEADCGAMPTPESIIAQ